MKRILFVLLAILLLVSCNGENQTPPQGENPSLEDGTTTNPGGGSSTPSVNAVTLEGFKIPSEVVNYTYGSGTFDMTGKSSVMLKCNETIGEVKFTGLDESKVYGVILISDGGVYPIVKENGEWRRYIDDKECYVCELPEYSIGTVVQAPETSEYLRYSSYCTFFCYRVKASDVSFADKANLMRISTRASEDVSFTTAAYVDGVRTYSNMIDLETGNELVITCRAAWDAGKNTGTYQINLVEQTQLAVGQSATLTSPGAYRIPASQEELVLEIAEKEPSLYKTVYTDVESCRIFLLGNDGATSRYYVDTIGCDRALTYSITDMDNYTLVRDEIADGIKLRTLTDTDKAEILYLDFVSDGNGAYVATVTKDKLESFITLDFVEEQSLVFACNFPQDTVLDSSITVDITATDFELEKKKSSMNCITPDGEINDTWAYGMPISGYLEFLAYTTDNTTLPDTAKLTVSVKLTY